MNLPSLGRAVFVFLLGAIAPHLHAAPPPNVVFILVDDFGWTDLACFGSDLYRTPNVDRLAREGMRFDNAYAACTVCSPTRASIMTGQYPARVHVTDWIPGHQRPFGKLKVPAWDEFLDLKYYTLAEALRDAGYLTAHFGKWHLGEDAKYWPEHQGFALNQGGWSRGSPNKSAQADGYFSPYGNPRLTDGPKGEYLTERMSRDVSAFIEQNREKPFFINLWFYAVHLPLQGPADKVAKYKTLIQTNARHRNPTYAAMVESMDDAVGQVMATLDRLKLSDNTIIIFTSDNGGLIGNRGDTSLPPKVTSNAPLRTGKGDRYEGGVRVPLIVRIPHRVKPNSVSHVPVISPDFYPTILALTHTKPRDQVFDGVDFTSVLEGKAEKLTRDAIYWHYPHYHNEGGVPYSAMRQGDWKLVENLETQKAELFNLATDLSEKNDLAATEPGKRDELLANLHAWRTKVGAQMPTVNPNYDPAKANQSPPAVEQ